MAHLALIAGQGHLPAFLAAALDASATPFAVYELDGFPSQPLGNHPVERFRIEHLGSFLGGLTARGVTEVVFAGAIRRPAIDPDRIDAATMPLVPRMMAALQAGDDAALRVVIAIFEEAGLVIRAPHQIAPVLLPPAGILSQVQPTEAHQRDALRGAEIVAALSAADIGQSCIVARGQALAVEALPGTDWMIRSLVARDAALPRGGLLYKAPKAAQDRRIDLPTIGPDTVRAAAEAGLEGIVIKAGGVMVLDRQLCTKIADDAGLFLLVRA
jgi:hypothetical protein